MAGLYYHIPFCTKRCIYCDFYFVTTSKVYDVFTEAMLLEIEHYGRRYGKKEPIRTLYFGGGTPSLLPLEHLDRILAHTKQWFDTRLVTETTLEVNPDDLNRVYLEALRALGVNRLSIGVQSFLQEDLSFMGRAHHALQAEKAIGLAYEAGFENFSADLIFGLPHQSLAAWEENLKKMVAYGVPHISAYGLTVEDGTVLHNRVKRGLVQETPENDLSDLFLFTIDYLEGHGYEHYEISNFAKKGFRSQHNQAYWQHENYLGLGPSAHSFWWEHPPSPKVRRWWNARDIRYYQSALRQLYKLPIEEEDQLNFQSLVNEYILLRLRTSDGLDLARLEDLYGYDLLMEKLDEIAWLEQEQYILPIRQHKIRLTNKGKLICDAVTQKLLT